MRVTYMTSVNHTPAAIATTILHAYTSAAKSPQTTTNPRLRPKTSRKFGLKSSGARPTNDRSRQRNCSLLLSPNDRALRISVARLAEQKFRPPQLHVVYR